jgi:Na+-transporting methylmalonyl-CoA/oxaloacetate decarboxylase gamma subunit
MILKFVYLIILLLLFFCIGYVVGSIEKESLNKKKEGKK